MARVLIGVDGSDLAYNAAVQAKEMLAIDEVIVASVVRPLLATDVAAAVPGGATLAVSGMDADVVSELHREAQEAAAATAALFGPDTTIEVVDGDPAERLCKLATQHQVDVVVVGSHGKGWIKRVVLGSTSSYVVNHAPCGVLVVRAGTKDATGEVLVVPTA